MIKLSTDIEQSKILGKFLQKESADMGWNLFSDGTVRLLPINDWDLTKDGSGNIEFYPAWSLAALLGVSPTTIGNFFEKNALRLRMDKGENDFNIWYENFDYENFDYGTVAEGLDVVEDNPIDACYKMIVKLHEQNLL